MKNSKNNTLAVKPCPFCGGYPLIENAGGVFIECAECGTSIRQKETQREAVEFWNTRLVFGEDSGANSTENGTNSTKNVINSTKNGANGDE